MAQHIELHTVNRITVDAVGPPGQRMFILQASDALNTITLKLEKEQARALAYKAQELLENIEEEFPNLDSVANVKPSFLDTQISGPLEPLFVVGQMGLGYDHDKDRIVLAAQELVLEETQEPSTAQFWISRAQLKGMSEHTLTVAEQGRPICPLCGRPIDAYGHFCPQRNGHDKLPQ